MTIPDEDGVLQSSDFPDDLKSLIEDWFYDRYVFNDEKFPRYFSRELSKDFGQYWELLRVQPGIAHYDWLVEEYEESRREHASQNTQSGTQSGSTTYGRTVETVSDDLHTGTVETDHTQDPESNYDQTNGSAEQTFGHTQNTEDSASNSNSSTTETLLKQGSKDGHKGVSKTAPQVAQYNSATAGEIPALNWQYIGAQEQTEDTHEIVGTDPDVVSASGSGSNSGSSKTVEGGSNGSSDARKTSMSRNDKNLTTYNEGTNGSRQESQGGSDKSTQENTGSGSESGEETEIRTGRHGNPAEILKQAVSFIQGTNAWNWLMEQLEDYFIGVYDI